MKVIIARKPTLAFIHLFIMAATWLVKYITYVSFSTTVKVVTHLVVMKL